MMVFDPGLLFFFVRDALAPYSENFIIDDRQNPVRIRLNGTVYSTVVRYVHDSGIGRGNEDEVRIQLDRRLIEKQRERQDDGQQIAFVGFFETGDTFVAWDPRHVFSLQAKEVVSIYARSWQRTSVSNNQAAVYQFTSQRLGEQSFAIALSASALGFYLENVQRFHALQSETSIVNLITDHNAVFSGAALNTGGEIDFNDHGMRDKFKYERTAYPRDPKFKRQVLEAYDGTCCICDRQLGIVQAAHIIPHSTLDSPNHVTNGLALCVEHHRFYDDALLLPDPEYRLHFNEQRAEYLRQTRQDKGLQEISKLHGKLFTVPDDEQLKPRTEYLRRGLELRLGP